MHIPTFCQKRAAPISLDIRADLSLAPDARHKSLIIIHLYRQRSAAYYLSPHSACYNPL